MSRPFRGPHGRADDLLQVVLDDATVERLRTGATGRGIAVEQLVVNILHAASWDLDRVLPRTDAPFEDSSAGSDTDGRGLRT